MTVTVNAAESNRAVLRSVREVTWGTTPTAVVSKALRITKSGLVVSKDVKSSEEIRADRQIASNIELGASTGGPIEFEGSAGGQDDFYEDFLLGTWSRDMNYLLVKGASVSVTGASQITIAGTDYRNWITTGKYIKLEGFVTVGNNGYFAVSAKSLVGTDTVITVTETSLTAEAGTAYTKLLDASDVILKATDISITSGSVIDAGAATPFTGSAVQVGQTLYFEGLGKETGTITASGTDPAEGDTITISDGVDTLVFEVRTDSALVASGNIHVAFSGTPNTMAASLNAAINAQFAKAAFRISATVATDTVTLTNHRNTGGSITESSGGFTTSAFSGGSTSKSGFVTVLSIPTNDTITVSPALTADANSGTKTVIIKGSHLRNPGTVASITKRSRSFETGFTDVAKYFEHRGNRADKIKLEIKAGSIVTGSITYKGGDTFTATSTVLGNTSNYTVLEATVTEPWNATANVGTILKDGVALTTAVTEVSLELDNNARDQKAVGNRFPGGIGYGSIKGKGKVMAYFSDFTNFNTFLNHVTTSLVIPIEDADHNAYRFTMPALKFTSDPIAPGGLDQDIMEDIEFMVQRDPATQTTFMVDRFSSVFPFSGA